MTDDEIDEAAEQAAEIVVDSPAMDPKHATQEQSLDYLNGVISSLRTHIHGIEEDLGIR